MLDGPSKKDIEERVGCPMRYYGLGPCAVCGGFMRDPDEDPTFCSICYGHICQKCVVLFLGPSGKVVPVCVDCLKSMVPEGGQG